MTLRFRIAAAALGLAFCAAGASAQEPGTGSAPELAGPAPVVAPRPVHRQARERDASGESASRTLDAEAARERLLEQLLKAADAGIVRMEDAGAATAAAPPDATGSPDIAATGAGAGDAPEPASADAPDAAASETQDAADPAIVEAPAAPAHPEHPAPPTPDPLPGDPGTTARTEAPVARCHTDAELALPHVVSPREFAAGLHAVTGRLVGEFDRPDGDAADEAARLLLAAELDNEAALVLETFAEPGPGARLLADIATLIRGGLPQAASSIWKDDCLGSQALWRAYAQASAGVNSAAVQSERASGQAMEHLPLGLRRRVAAAIGLAAVRQGLWDDARRLEAAASRAANSLGESAADLELLSARLLLWQEAPAAAIAVLETASGRTGPHAEEALLALAGMARDGAAPTTDWQDARLAALRTDLGTLARLSEDRGRAAEAVVLEAALSAGANGLDDAVEVLSDGLARDLIDAERYLSVLAEISGDGAGPADRTPLALVHLRGGGGLVPALDQAEFRHALVMSYAELGLPGLATPLLRDEDYGNAALVEALALSLLATGSARAALDLAERLPEGPQRLRAEGAALIALGNHAQGVRRLEMARAGGADRADAVTDLLMRERPADLPAGVFLDEAAVALGATGDPDLAERAALTALGEGHDQMPPVARRALAAAAPDRLDRLDRLFAPLPPVAAPSSAGIKPVLGQLDAEIVTLTEMLNDG